MPGMIDWRKAYDELAAADRGRALDAAGLERFAIAAYLTGRDTDSVDVLSRAHAAWLAASEPARAARAAFWIAFILMHVGERARAGGWLARARRLLEEGRHDCVECGYMLLPVALQHIAEGRIVEAEAIFADAVAVGARFGDADLVNLALQGRGRALINVGQVARGIAMLDEVMVAATSGEISPIVTGTIYCSVVSACFELFDMRRAQEWTGALDTWCASQPGLVPYRGECLVHRAEIMALHGVWPRALDEAERACEALSASHIAAGAALYQLAEIHRVRGDFARAEESYRRANESGRMPYPGLALLRLAQGRRDAARKAIVRVLDEARDRRLRSTILPAAVEVFLGAPGGGLAREDLGAARAAADELAAIAEAFETPFIRARSAHAMAAVALAEGDAKRALGLVRGALAIWRDLEFPYETARSTVLAAIACRSVGDADAAEMELSAAARVFAELGATPDLARIEQLAARETNGGPLTARELEVLKLVASGRSNRGIADDLGISEKTVARHVSNIFTKLDLPSRAAATAYAFKNSLV